MFRGKLSNTEPGQPPTGRIAHGLSPMVGRDPREKGRVASPLELLLDLTFVVAISTSASQLAEMTSAGHVASAIGAFVLASFAICIAWINFSWFGSAFDTDDWLYRILTMVQMMGVVVFALGLPAMYRSVEEGHHLDLRLMVIGYVVMRIAIVFQWWRVARSAPQYRKVAHSHIRWTVFIQVAWVGLSFSGLPTLVMVPLFLMIGVFELLLPMITQGAADGIPWHPHHMAERFSLFAIITLGESVVGTVASSSGLLGGADGLTWTTNTVAVVIAGVGLTFGMWWVYFATPFGEVLQHRKRRGYLFGYGHIPLFIGTAGVGAGLHVAGLYLEHDSALNETTVVLAVAAPVALYVAMVYILHTLLFFSGGTFHAVLLGTTLAILAATVGMAALGAPMSVCLLLIMAAPFVTVVGYETIGHTHQGQMLAKLDEKAE